MKVGFAGLTVLLLLFCLLFAGCDQANAPLSDIESESILAAPAVAASCHQLSDAQRNQLILDEAKKWLNKEGGQCKEWIQAKVVWNASGNVVFLPQNFSKPGDAYHLAKWNDSPDVRVVWQMAYACPTSFPSSLKPGHIIQLRWNKSVPKYGGGPHTAIIEQVNSTTMTWLDSNWKGDVMVTRHPFTLNDWWQKVEAWTVYQVK